MLGAYPGYRGSIQTAASNVGLSTLPFAMGFGDNATAAAESSGAAAFAQWATAAGSRLIWGFTMLPNDGSVTLAQCATGAINATAVSCAQALVANGQANAIWRIGWEMNGSWFLWATVLVVRWQVSTPTTSLPSGSSSRPHARSLVRTSSSVASTRHCSPARPTRRSS